jgi:hypothetical protein
MKTFRIMSMSVKGDEPDTTELTVSVIDEHEGIKKHTVYEFAVNGRHENISDTLQEQVSTKLSQAGLI